MDKQHFSPDVVRRIKSSGSVLVDGANPLWVTQKSRREFLHDSIEADWASGKEFRIYQFADLVTVADTDRAMKAGFTHVRVVFQRPDHTVAAVDIELAKHRS